MYIHKIKIPYQFLSGYSGFYLCSKKKSLPENLYFRSIFWSTILGVCASHLLCPTFENGGGTKSDDFGVCVSVPSQIFWSVPANGIKRVGPHYFSYPSVSGYVTRFFSAILSVCVFVCALLDCIAAWSVVSRVGLARPSGGGAVIKLKLGHAFFYDMILNKCKSVVCV